MVTVMPDSSESTSSRGALMIFRYGYGTIFFVTFCYIIVTFFTFQSFCNEIDFSLRLRLLYLPLWLLTAQVQELQNILFQKKV